jgi:hypothetical protein
MTQLDVDLAALRARRRSPGLYARLRSLALFDRRGIKEPDERDAYWVNVQRRLAESDGAFLTRYDPYGVTSADPRPQLPAARSDDA